MEGGSGAKGICFEAAMGSKLEEKPAGSVPLRCGRTQHSSFFFFLLRPNELVHTKTENPNSATSNCVGFTGGEGCTRTEARGKGEESICVKYYFIISEQKV